MARRDTTASGGYAPRLVMSWLIVGVPLVYGVLQAVKSSLPLFAG